MKSTITESNWKAYNIYLSNNYVKDDTGDVRKVLGIQTETRQVTLWMRINGDTLEAEMRPFRGHTFYCHNCEEWESLDTLWLDGYPGFFVCDRQITVKSNV